MLLSWGCLIPAWANSGEKKDGCGCIWVCARVARMLCVWLGFGERVRCGGETGYAYVCACVPK